MTTTIKHCAGLVGRSPHDTPTTEFGKDTHTKDSLARYCKACMKAWRDSKKPVTIEALSSVVDAAAMAAGQAYAQGGGREEAQAAARAVVPKGWVETIATQEALAATQPSTPGDLNDPAFVGTDEGQAALAAAYERDQAQRRATAAANRKRQRAEAKARATGQYTGPASDGGGQSPD